jgi:hypothetical protein
VAERLKAMDAGDRADFADRLERNLRKMGRRDGRED